MRFSSTDRPGKMPRDSGVTSTPLRARQYGARFETSAPRDRDRPGPDGHDPRDRRTERGLAAAVRAEQRGDLTGAHPEVDAVEDLDLLVAGVEPVHGEHDVAGRFGLAAVGVHRAFRDELAAEPRRLDLDQRFFFLHRRGRGGHRHAERRGALGPALHAAGRSSASR